MGPGGDEGGEGVEPGGVGVGVGGDVDAERAALICAMTCGIFPQLALPAHLRCQISTGMWASRPMRMASSMAAGSASPSLRMWVA